MSARLRQWQYSRKECIAALRGEAVPQNLGHPLLQLCTIHGIRYHHGFGEEFRGVLPVFTRALDARSIMSNIIPDLETAEVTPYCIWHPATASEETYRELYQCYPHLSYQIGRACALAGYKELYSELDILPDVHIAEEARECGNVDIFEAIMLQPVRYSVMNDYSRSLELDNRRPANLNGDTAVCWMLDVKQAFSSPTATLIEDEDGDLMSDDCGLFSTWATRKGHSI